MFLEDLPEDFFKEMTRLYDKMVVVLAKRGISIWVDGRFKRLDYYKEHRVKGYRHWSVLYRHWSSCSYMRRDFERVIFKFAPQMTFDLRDKIIHAAICRMAQIYLARKDPMMAPKRPPHMQDCKVHWYKLEVKSMRYSLVRSWQK